MYSKKIKSGFTLVEAMAALLVLGIITTSVITIFSRCSTGLLDSTRKMQAFEVARENMENLLLENGFSEMSEYGYSEKYPHIEWTTRIETFYEPVYKNMWLKAVCSAEYEDSDGEIQTVEFSNWLTKLNPAQMENVIKARDKLQDLYDERYGQDFNEPYFDDPNMTFDNEPNL